MTPKKRIYDKPLITILSLLMVITGMAVSAASREQATITYENTLTKIEDPLPILADYPEYVEPLEYESRFFAPPVVNEKDGELLVRSWRFWSNAHGIVEMENRLEAKATAIINVFAWGVDDGQGIKTPQPAGVVLLGTPEKNKLTPKQIDEVVNPFLNRLREHVLLVGHTLPGREDRIDRANMDFSYLRFGGKQSEAYERVLLDGMNGRPSLFWRADGVESAWRAVDPLLKGPDEETAESFPNYEPETWGPPEADALLRRDGRRWSVT